MIPCDKCKDGSCRICQSSCSFVVKISNYNYVKLARLAKEREIPVPAEVDNARNYLNSATSLKEGTIKAATTSYVQTNRKRGETQTQRGHRPCHLPLLSKSRTTFYIPSWTTGAPQACCKNEAHVPSEGRILDKREWCRPQPW